ncbi:MAG: transposase [Elusimicrobiota bacterium]
MGRPHRIQFPGACYHVVLRGNNHRDIFLTNQDRRCFLSLLRGYKDRYRIKVYAYCLMRGHAQLLLETAESNLSKVMQGFNTAYTKYFNQQHNTAGHVFSGRYKALLVDKANHLLQLTRHIHLAPVRDGLRDKPWRYQWSSCPAYVEAESREPFVDSEAVLRAFARNRLKQSVRYLQYVKRRPKRTEAELPLVSGLFVGSREFAESVRKRSGSSGGAAGAGTDSSRSAADAKAILAEVSKKHGIDQEKLFGRGQWREVSAVRKEAIYRMWKEAGMGVTEIGRIFKRTPSAVSQLIRSMEVSRVSRN